MATPKIHYRLKRRQRGDLRYAIPLADLAKQLHYHPETLRQWIAKGKLRGYLVRGRWYAIPPAVERRLFHQRCR